MRKTYSLMATGLISLLFMTVTTPVVFANDIFIDARFIQLKKQETAPNFILSDLDGKQVQLTDFRGKTILIYFWTTW